MRVLCVGGGSGGHITPVEAIISEIRKQNPDAIIRFVTDKRFYNFAKEKMQAQNVVVSKVAAGKFRRYSNIKWYDHIKHIFISYIPNLIDVFKFCFGFVQSLCKIIAFRPDVVFVKGGYVGLPVGLATALLGRPLVLHDSDATPGLTNRILSKYAKKIGLGMPQDDSSYDSKKVEYVGIPIDSRYEEIDAGEKEMLRKKYVKGSTKPVILAMGGSQGSRMINDEIVKTYPSIKNEAEVYLITGENNYATVKKTIDENKRMYIGLRILPFVAGEEVFDLVGVSDLVITRAGATTIAELASEKKATIIIPSPYLASDHQSKNAELLMKANASIVINQRDLELEFLPAIKKMLSNTALRETTGNNLHKFFTKDAAKKMASIIVKEGKNAKK